MADYRFLTRWELQAPIETVWGAISDLTTYPTWFPYISEVTLIAPGDASGVGSAYRVKVRGKLPYSLSFTLENVRQDPPRLLESKSTGQLEGIGRRELSHAGDVTTALYYWHVRTTSRWMNVTAPLLSPVFSWNHHKVMDKGGTRLAAYLGARLVANTSREESSA
ncbi:SRPBCC family protein [Arthrobacter sp. ISL-85]|uniref:SRPBCC family protein n=1 Tax=Arthrobacter sp. ISL-85 TaxID=2819115 RepID=UPI001BE9C504|nr:SRPBCC family protein [Arthrobacter sp. ISL-85]MBT2568882.1 SRPBCC family protein [Arthrobacter sp. ISL-85]